MASCASFGSQPACGWKPPGAVALPAPFGVCPCFGAHGRTCGIPGVLWRMPHFRVETAGIAAFLASFGASPFCAGRTKQRWDFCGFYAKTGLELSFGQSYYHTQRRGRKRLIPVGTLLQAHTGVYQLFWGYPCPAFGKGLYGRITAPAPESINI